MSADTDQQLDLTGAVTFATHAALLEKSAILIGRGDLAINWADVDVVDSSAIALILACQRSARATRHHVEQRNLPDALIALARLYGVMDLVSVK